MFKIKANPTFVAAVSIPTAGAEPQPLKLVYRHKTRDQLKEYLERLAKIESSDAAPLMEIVAGWEDVDTEFSEEAMNLLVQNHHGSVPAILDKYVVELAEGRRGN